MKQVSSSEGRLVDIAVIAYNHEAFIETCLERIINQQVNYTWKITIYDDCSTDATGMICQKWQSAHPEQIEYIRHIQNIGISKNWEYVVYHSHAKYLAICEGDDYWLDPRKLQKQVNFMEANQHCSFCYHDVEYKGRFELERPVMVLPAKFAHSIRSIEELADGNFIVTVSALFRRSAITLPDWFSTIPVCDYAFFMLAAKHGPIGYIHQPMAVYRNDGGAWTGLDKKNKYLVWIKGLTALQQEFVNDPQVRSRLLHSILAHRAHLIEMGVTDADQDVAKVFDGVIDTYYHLVRENARLSKEPGISLAIKLLFKAAARPFTCLQKFSR